MVPVPKISPNLPEWTDLGMNGGASLQMIKANSHRVSWSGSDQRLSLASVLMPQWRWKYQTGPPLKARAVLPRFRQALWKSSTNIFPQYVGMAMGASDSAFSPMATNRRMVCETLASCPILREFTLLNCHIVRFRGQRVPASRGAIYLHVDDVIGARQYQWMSDLAITKIAETFQA